MSITALRAMRDIYRQKFGQYPPDMSDGRYWSRGPEMVQIEEALDSGTPIEEITDAQVDDSDGGSNY